jgi:hypothetical protein
MGFVPHPKKLVVPMWPVEDILEFETCWLTFSLQFYGYIYFSYQETNTINKNQNVF